MDTTILLDHEPTSDGAQLVVRALLCAFAARHRPRTRARR